MDRSWMDKARNTQAYIDGVVGFLEFAFTHSARGNAILCPCRKCLNFCWFEASDVYEHLLYHGFISGYKRWIYHGEVSSSLASDDLGVTRVNFKHLLKSDEPFILASQPTQVYYVQDDLDKDWCFVRSFPYPRDLYDMFGVEDEVYDQHDAPRVPIPDVDANVDLSVDVRNIPRSRTDVDGTLVRAIQQTKCIMLWMTNLRIGSWEALPRNGGISNQSRRVCILMTRPMWNSKLSLIIELAQQIGKNSLPFGKVKQGRNAANKENKIEKRWNYCIHQAAKVMLVFLMKCIRKMDIPLIDMKCLWKHTSARRLVPLEVLLQQICLQVFQKKIEAMENECPELLEKTIKQGDLFSHVTRNEKNGYVRCTGLGPSATDLGMPGTRKLKSTKLQMAEEEANAILHERVDKIEFGFQSVVASLKDEFLQMKRLLLQSNVRQNVEFSPWHDLSQNWVEADEDVYEGAYGSRHEDSVGSATANLEVRREKEATILQKKTEGALLQKKAAIFTQKNIEQSSPAQHEVLQEKGAAISQNKKATMQQDKDVTLQRNKMAISQWKEVPFTQKNYQQGRDVILYSVYRDHGSPVAKATILSIDRREVVGGQELGSKYCKVVMNYVIKRDAILPRGVGSMTTMGQAQGRCIAWPYKHLEVDKSMANAAMRPQGS